MADTRRLAALIEITRESNSKLVLAGDSAQLSPIGAGGLFTELKDHVPTAQLTEVHRAHHEWERNAWANLRSGDSERALGEYQARGRLHIEETRTEAGERMVSDWAATRAAHPGEWVVMITDASNHELDQLNKQAQQHRADAGQLGPQEVALPDRPYGLRAGDEILFTSPAPRPRCSIASREWNPRTGARSRMNATTCVLIRTEGAQAARDQPLTPASST